jgi:hypothetical protein
MPGRPFQKGEDPRRRTGLMPNRKANLCVANIKEAFRQQLETPIKTPEGNLPAWEAMIRGQMISVARGNPASFKVLIELANDLGLIDLGSNANRGNEVLIIGFKQPEDVIELQESPE